MIVVFFVGWVWYEVVFVELGFGLCCIVVVEVDGFMDFSDFIG